MTVHDISNYFNQSPNIAKAYKEHKSVGRLIRNNVFKYTSSRRYNDMDLIYKITYIKVKNGDSLQVNLKVSGTMGRNWKGDNRTCVTDYVEVSYSNSRSRNEDIRREVLYDVQKFFRLFGMDKHKVEIGKIKVCKEL